jgi:hypothetical protein
MFYSHVGQKFISKIRHLNVKPADPGKLSFSERIEWTPPFNSATEKWAGTYPFIQMLRYAIPAMLPFAFSLAGFFKGRRRMEDALIYWNALVFAISYLMFVRLEVLLVVCLIFTFGIAWRHFRELGKITSAVMMPVWAAFLGCLMLFEIALAAPPSKNIRNFLPESRDRMAALKGLVDAVKSSTEPDSVVLADFNISPVILAYTKRGIILHPKFESVNMRERVQKYYEVLFSTKEESLNLFCNEYGASHYVFTYYVWRAEKDSSGWLYSPKYIANAIDRGYMPYGFRWFVADDSRVAYFRPLPEWTVSVQDPKSGEYVARYKIFEVVSDYDRQKAFECLARGEMYVANESYGEAEMELSTAIELFPGLPSKAYTQLGMAYKQLGNDEKARKYMTMGATFTKEGRQ